MLLKAILASPLEDTPRLMYADAIQDENPAWAGLIRWQCDSAEGWRRGVSLLNPRRNKLEGWEFAAGGADILAGDRLSAALACAKSLPEPSGIRSGRCRVERGFVAYVEYSAVDWLAHADAILAAHPVTQATLTLPIGIDWAAQGMLGDEWVPYRGKDNFSITLDMIGQMLDGVLEFPRDIMAAMCRARWKGVGFTLPPLRAA